MEKLLKDRKSIYNPFIYVAGEKALAAGLVIIVASAFVGYLNNTWLDGVLDMHYGPRAPFYWHLFMGLVNWLLLLIILTPLAYTLSRSRIRFVDLAGTLALARFPMLIAIITGFLNAPDRVAQHLMYVYLEVGDPVPVSIFDFIITIIAGTLVLLMIVWMVALMYNGYRWSANLRGTRSGISFTVGFVVAYVLSKVVIGQMAGVLL